MTPFECLCFSFDDDVVETADVMFWCAADVVTIDSTCHGDKSLFPLTGACVLWLLLPCCAGAGRAVVDVVGILLRDLDFFGLASPLTVGVCACNIPRFD